MNTKLILYPYNLGSESAKLLASNFREVGIRSLRVKPDGNYRPFNSHVIINWGNSSMPQSWDGNRITLNKPSAVTIASNKLKTLQTLDNMDIPVPDWTTDKHDVTEWLEEGYTVLARTKLNAHSGEGILILRPNDIDWIVEAPLYVKYKKKRNEYRVHVFNGTVLSVQEKRRDREFERDADQSLVRSHANGWVFCRENVVYDDRLIEIATKAIDALGLDFGAVDIIYNEREDAYYVLEVNTAPGLSGQTLQEYTDAFVNYYNNH